MQLTSGGAALVAMGLSVDHERARAADAFTTVMVEHHGFLTLGDETLVQDIEHLKERGFVADLLDRVVLEVAGIVRAFLAPDAQGEVGQMIAHL